MLQSQEKARGAAEGREGSIPVTAKPKRKRRRIIETHRSGSEESYEPDFNQYKIVGLPVDMRRVTTGNWGLEENKTYLEFLRSYKKDFQDEVSRRRSTVFNRLSKALRKRTPDQCRSHHQKLQNRFKNNIDLILDFVRSKIEKQLVEGEEKEGREGKAFGTLRPTGTGTIEEEEEDDQCIVIDMAELAIW